MRTITNAYLGNLAVADMLCLCSVDYHFVISHLISPRVRTYPYKSSVGYAISYTIQYTSHYTSIALVSLMTVERYLGICKTFYHRLVIAKGRTLKLIVFAWVFGLASSCAFTGSPAVGMAKTCVLWPESKFYNNLPRMLHFYTHPPHPFYTSNMFQILQAIPYTLAWP